MVQESLASVKKGLENKRHVNIACINRKLSIGPGVNGQGEGGGTPI